MNYAKLDTASDILEAFRLCNNPGEEIELFESLATRPNPPVTAFVEILQMIRLEPALVLTIKAFGTITDAEVKERLKQSDDLLVMLSQQANSGASDLIRWAAAVAIDTIGFGYVAISRNLPETPDKIAEKIVESKRKILIDYDDKNKGEQNITDRNDYGDFIKFWIYGATYDLRAITAKYCGKNSSIVVREVVKAQVIHGIKETNKLFQKAEARDYPDKLTKQIYENELFEGFTHRLCTKLLKEENPNEFKHLVINQGHCLQSNDPQIRLKAASIILGINENVLSTLAPCASTLLSVSRAISDCDFNLNTDFYYKNLVYEYLKEIVDNLRFASDLVSRDGVSKHFTDYLSKLSKDLDFLSPGLSWKQIQAIAETKRKEEAQRLADIRKRKQAEEYRRKQEEDQRQADIRQKEAQRLADIKKRKQAEEYRRKQEEDQRLAKERVATLAEERRLAKANADARLAKNILSASVILMTVGLLFLYPATICINAYLHDTNHTSPLNIIGVGALFGPVVWLLVAFQFCMILLVGIFVGFHYPDSVLVSAGGSFLALIGSSVWIIIPLLIGLLTDLVKEK